ncbi:MAG: hypothetical protein RLZZ155_1564, partial [Bacteroidota bacterium]
DFLQCINAVGSGNHGRCCNEGQGEDQSQSQGCRKSRIDVRLLNVFALDKRRAKTNLRKDFSEAH